MDRETLLGAVNYDYPARVPITFHTSLACWYCQERHVLDKIAEGHPLPLSGLMGNIVYHILGLIERVIEYVDWERVEYLEDLGIQIGLMLSPSLLKKQTAPLYRDLMEPQGTVIYMYSDGDTRALPNQLLRLLVRILNVQDRTNLIKWLKEDFKNRVVIDLYIDCQFIAQQNNPYKVQEYLNYVMKELYDEAGGLILAYGLCLYTPMLIVRVIADYFEEIFLGGGAWTI